jgi:hypothetical protein
MRFEVVVGGAQRLPDPRKIRLAIDASRDSDRCRRRLGLATRPDRGERDPTTSAGKKYALFLCCISGPLPLVLIAARRIGVR